MNKILWKNAIYTIEKTHNANYYGDHKYRFRSLINNCVGAWLYDKNIALNQGEQHALLMLEIYPSIKEYFT